MIKAVPWFREIWRDKHNLARVLGDYSAIGKQMPHALADIAARGFVYSSFPTANKTGRPTDYYLGRRDLALEIMQLAKADPNEIYDLIEIPDRPERKPKGD